MNAPFLKRFFIETPLSSHTTLIPNAALSHRLLHVLRMTDGEAIQLFDGNNACDFNAIVRIRGKKISFDILETTTVNRESSLALHVGQGIAKPERMDFAVQKAVEIGATQFTPLICDFCGFKPTKTVLEKKYEHWQSIAIHAAEQSGRNAIMHILPAMPLSEWLQKNFEFKIFLEPSAHATLHSVIHTHQTLPKPNLVAMTIGPEGGFSEPEIALAATTDWQAIALGPRIFRTETASLVLCSIFQYLWGDLG